VPYPRLAPSEYCQGYGGVGDPGCWSLSVRDWFLSYLDGCDFQQHSQWLCTLTDRETALADSFGCGELLYGVIKGVTAGDLDRVIRLTDGTVGKFPSGPFDYGVLHVPVGTEIEAVHKIVFNPDLRYVSFDWFSGVVGTLWQVPPPNKRLQLALHPPVQMPLLRGGVRLLGMVRSCRGLCSVDPRAFQGAASMRRPGCQ